MNDSLPFGRIHIGSHGNHVLGIVVFDGEQISKFTVKSLLLSNQIGRFTSVTKNLDGYKGLSFNVFNLSRSGARPSIGSVTTFSWLLLQYAKAPGTRSTRATLIRNN